MAEMVTKAQLIAYLRGRRSELGRTRYVYWNSRRLTVGSAMRRAEELTGLETIIRWYDHILVLNSSTRRKHPGLSAGQF